MQKLHQKHNCTDTQTHTYKHTHEILMRFKLISIITAYDILQHEILTIDDWDALQKLIKIINDLVGIQSWSLYISLYLSLFLFLSLSLSLNPLWQKKSLVRNPLLKLWKESASNDSIAPVSVIDWRTRQTGNNFSYNAMHKRFLRQTTNTTNSNEQSNIQYNTTQTQTQPQT